MTASGTKIFSGIFKARCVSVDSNVITIYVPQVFGDTPITTSNVMDVYPKAGTFGYVTFEGGDPAFPIWVGSMAGPYYTDAESKEPLYVAERDATREPMGHTDLTQSTLSFDNTTRTFTIAPSGVSDYFEVWCDGIAYRKTTPEHIVIPNASGVYYIYYSPGGLLKYKTTFFDLSVDAPTSYIYWNASDSKEAFFADERHGIVLDWQTHEYLHRTRGAALASGFNAGNYVIGGNGSSNADAQIDIANGTLFDEDIQIDITNSVSPTLNTWQQQIQGPAKIPVLYRSGTAWTCDSPTNFPLKQGTALPKYNSVSGGTWSATDAGNNKYINMYLIATNNLNYPIISIMGQAEYSNQASAEAVVMSQLDLSGLPIYEYKPLYHLVFRVSTGYSNTPHASLYSLIDNRSIQSLGSLVSTNAISGTADQVYVNGGTAAQTGNVTLSLPQSINTTSSPSFNVITSTAATGTAPLTVASTTLVTNLNADLLDGQHASFYMPSGLLSPYAGSTAPTGWLLCYGQAISRTTYAALFAAIGTTYGIGNGSTTFNVPDLRGRVPVALDNMGGTDAGRLSASNTLGGSGGAETHTLTSAEMPVHSHANTLSDSGHGHTAGKYDGFGIGNAAVPSGGTYQAVIADGSVATTRIGVNSNTTGITLSNANAGGSAGTTQAHNNMQPYVLLNYIIKT